MTVTSTDRRPRAHDGRHRVHVRRSPRNWHDEHVHSLTLGQRAADRMRNGMGSWPFIAAFVAVLAAWIATNSVAGGWDPYPYILLNLFLSMIAGLQGSILLIAAKRQDAIAAALAQHDFETDTAAKREIEELAEIIREQLRILEELRALQDPAPGGRSSVRAGLAGAEIEGPSAQGA